MRSFYQYFSSDFLPLSLVDHAMGEFTDQCGYTVKLDAPPARIISLVPSQTELLSDLGLEARVVGVTKFCVHPAHWRKEKTVVGGTKQFDFGVIDRLKPDLIIGNKEENYKEGIEQLKEKYPVWVSDIFNLQDALTMIGQVGSMCDCVEQSHRVIRDIENAFALLRKHQSKRVLYLIWKKPWMAAGKNTFIDSMLSLIGLENVVVKERYPILTDDEIRHLNPEVVLLSSEPFPFREKHVKELAGLVQNSKILLVDGEMFSWYGSRLRLTPMYLNSLKCI